MTDPTATDAVTDPAPTGPAPGEPGLFPVDVWSEVVGQPRAVDLLRAAAAGDPVHAWLFVGPTGSGKRAAARAFAGELLAAEADAAGDAEGAARARHLALNEQHPDLIVVERVGASISSEQADEIITRASRSATEGQRKVLVLDEFHLMADGVAPKLLKTIEEPTPGTFFVVLADELPPGLVTIASRCVRVDFAPVPTDAIVARLVADGVPAERAAEAAGFAGGDLRRARLLATDERLALRVAAWRDLPRHLDGKGAAATRAVADLRGAIDDVEAPLRARQDQEVADLQERIERYGQRGSGARELEARHKREVRRLRTDELRLGLSALAGTYRDELVVAADPSVAIAGIEAVRAAETDLTFNPNEELWLTALALRLPPLN
ncbi:MAG TPA: AAA family ATPase [Acidimicrobiales bacterium]|nr:AAA family ATPase [Acidimicrobiales bacterium]HMS90051.1 AAA family ATPase [Acidimicrobiales bacterium]HRA35013.1 AAA family ATPase [Acidimicrobiales bacterium]